MPYNRTSDRRLVYVLNPAAGKGQAMPRAYRAAREAGADLVHLTERKDECTSFIAETCLRDPHAHFVVYGGDGTANEAVTGILRAGAGNHALLSVIPAGVHSYALRALAPFLPAAETGGRPIDLIALNGRYAIGGCTLAADEGAFDRFGAGISLFGSGRRVAPFSASVTLDDGRGTETLAGEFILAAAANLPSVGPIDRAASAADPTDGVLDVVLIRASAQDQLRTLVRSLTRGTHVNPETLRAYPPFSDCIEYRQCRSLWMESGAPAMLDGDAFPAVGIRAAALPAAVRMAAPPR